MLLRTAGSVADVLTLFKLAIFHDVKGTLFNYVVNVLVAILALVMMRHMHTEAYQVFYNFVTGVLNPSVLIVMAMLTIVLVGLEFIFVGVTFYPKGHVPTLVVKLITSIRDSTVVLSGATLSLAVMMYDKDPEERIKAVALSALYFASAYFIAFVTLAPFWLDSRRFSDRVALVLAGGGLIALVWYWPDLFNPEFINLNWISQ
ncbi:MAG: hypothetical protein ACM3ZT_06365 [Bacillota bacterium]